MIEDILKGVLGGRAAEWIEVLTSRFDFSLEQAQAFVPDAIESLVGLVGGGDLDLSQGIDPRAILSKLNIGDLASKVGVGAEKATAGVEAILDDTKASLGDQMAGMNDLLSQLGGEGSEGLGNLGDLFGK